MRRVACLAALLSAAGAAIFYFAAGPDAPLAFLGGAFISCLSLWLLHRLVADLHAASEGRKVRAASLLLHAFRMLILGLAAYAIVGVYGTSRSALAAGLTVAVTAATIEVLIELFYARA